MTLLPVPGPAGHYAAKFVEPAAGAYEIVIEARIGELTKSADPIAVEVGRPNMEFEELDYPMVLQAVRELYSFDAHDGEHAGGTEVVIIGRDLDEDEYRAAFERTVAP